MSERLLHYLLPVFKFILFIFFIIMCILPFGLFAQLNLITLNPDALTTDIVFECVALTVVLGALLMVFKVFSPLYFDDVFVVKSNVFSGFFKGALIGFTILVVCAGLAYANKNVSFTLGGISLQLLLGYFLLYLLVGMFEELLFRSYPLFVFSSGYMPIAGIIITGILFGFAHLGNDDFNWLAMLNISLAGVLFAQLILIKRNIAWAIGIHFGWNFTQGVLLGYKVSGTKAIGFLIAKPIGPTYLSGGSFGIESSVFCTAVLLIPIIYLSIKYPIQPIQNDSVEQTFEEI